MSTAALFWCAHLCKVAQRDHITVIINKIQIGIKDRNITN